jgi:cystathionine gamma-synthase/cystathionine gamma-lyase/cystathionine beta-lyase
MRFDTQLVHAGEPDPKPGGAVAMPIFQSSTFATPDAGDSEYSSVRYARLSNTPNHLALHAKLAALEGAEAALVTASGMAAISTTLLALLRPGDHVLVQDCVYGGTHDLLTKDLPALGIEATFVDPPTPALLQQALRPATRLVYVEAISNPLLQVPALADVASFAKQNGLLAVIDNTFASPYLYQPARDGFDLSLHSATKYLNGHTDLVAGAVIGKTELVKLVKRKLDHLGGFLDPHAVWLLHRGIKTLSLRMRRQCETALVLAELLARHPAVARVHHPTFAGSPDRDRALRTFRDGLGGAMVSFDLYGGEEAAKAFIDSSRLCTHAPSLGGLETLVTRPAATSHLGMPKAKRDRRGITQGLVRVSVGIEDAADLCDDFHAALAVAADWRTVTA